MFFDRDARPASGRFVWVVEDELTEAAGGLTIEHPELLAFLVARRIGAEWELENIAVAPSARRHGFGALLLRKLIGEASAANGESIFLEMRKSNLGARSLYRKFGFREQGLRKSYYSDPPEDAILYRLVLN